MSPDRPQARPRRQEACSSEGCAPHIGWIIQHAGDRGSIQICRTAPGLTAHLMQAPAHFAHTQSIQTYPCEDKTYDVRLIFHHFEARHAAALSSAHVAVAEGSARQRTDRA